MKPASKASAKVRVIALFLCVLFLIYLSPVDPLCLMSFTGPTTTNTPQQRRNLRAKTLSRRRRNLLENLSLVVAQTQSLRGGQSWRGRQTQSHLLRSYLLRQRGGGSVSARLGRGVLRRRIFLLRLSLRVFSHLKVLLLPLKIVPAGDSVTTVSKNSVDTLSSTAVVADGVKAGECMLETSSPDNCQATRCQVLPLSFDTYLPRDNCHVTPCQPVPQIIT